MTVHDLRAALARLADLLGAADPASAAADELAAFARGAAAFDHLPLDTFLRLAELGRGLHDPKVLAAEVRVCYERSGDPAVTPGRVREVCGRLGPLPKPALVALGGAVGLKGLGRRRKDEIVAAITGRLLDRTAAPPSQAPPPPPGPPLPPGSARLDAAPLACDRGRWAVPVPWDERAAVHEFLRARGCPTTLCMDPRALEAHLVLGPGVDPGRVAALLAERRGRPDAPGDPPE